VRNEGRSPLFTIDPGATALHGPMRCGAATPIPFVALVTAALGGIVCDRPAWLMTQRGREVRR